MKIATYNVNGVNGRLPVLLDWLAEAGPDVVCLQELKAPQEKFPAAAIRDAGYEAVWLGQKSWNGVAILARGEAPVETRRGLPGEPDPGQSRYIEAAVNGILIGCLYLPNGNPAPGPKFDHKLAWFEAFISHATSLLATGVLVVLAGDYNVMPTDLDVHKPERSVDDALFRPELRDALHRLAAQGRGGSCLEEGWLHTANTAYRMASNYVDFKLNAFAARQGDDRLDPDDVKSAAGPRALVSGALSRVRIVYILLGGQATRRRQNTAVEGRPIAGADAGRGILSIRRQFEHIDAQAFLLWRVDPLQNVQDVAFSVGRDERWILVPQHLPKIFVSSYIAN